MVVPPLPNAHLPAHLRVQSCLEEWCGLGDRYVEEVVKNGLHLDWVDVFDGEDQAPVATYENSSTHCPHVRRLLEAAARDGILKEVSKDQLRCVSAPFAIDKKHAPGEEEKRLILNLRNVNMWVRTEHFALPSLGRVLPYLRKGQWACVIDLKGAYNHLPLSEETKRWLGVRNGETFYQCQALPFGLNCAPREWQRLMTPILNALRSLGALVWVYLDDWLLIGPTEVRTRELAQALVDLLTKLGIQIAPSKGNLQPQQVVIYLGFAIDLWHGRLTVPPHKLKSVTRRLKELLRRPCLTPRSLSSAVGTVRALSVAVPHVRLLTDTLVANLSVAQRFGWETERTLPPETLKQVESTLAELQQWQGRAFDLQLPERSVWSDASGAGWGATLSLVGGEASWGWFTGDHSKWHINQKEMKAGINAFRAFGLKNCRVHLYTDSMVFWWYLHNTGGRVLRLNNLMRQMHEIVQQNGLELVPHYVPSADNPADIWSRLAEGQNPKIQIASCSLPIETMEWIHQHFRTQIIPICDWMASELNAVADSFISEIPTRLAAGVDFFRSNLAEFSPGWLYPPISAIPNVIQKLLSESNFRCLLVVPYTHRKIWWSQMKSMMIGEPLIWNCQTLISETGLPVTTSLSLCCVLLCRGSMNTVERPLKRQRS